jgi:predicted RNase H-like nuclease (RuvC/YqgF family)
MTLDERFQALRKTSKRWKKERRELEKKLGIVKDERDSLKKEVAHLEERVSEEYWRGMDIGRGIDSDDW